MVRHGLLSLRLANETDFSLEGAINAAGLGPGCAFSHWHHTAEVLTGSSCCRVNQAVGLVEDASRPSKSHGDLIKAYY